MRTFDLIVSNPPYLSDSEILELDPDVCYEPLGALHAGDDGLDIIRRIAAGAPAHLAREGELIVEVGMRQAPAVVKLLEDAGMSVAAVINDFAGYPRVVRARKEGT